MDNLLHIQSNKHFSAQIQVNVITCEQTIVTRRVSPFLSTVTMAAAHCTTGSAASAPTGSISTHKQFIIGQWCTYCCMVLLFPSLCNWYLQFVYQ